MSIQNRHRILFVAYSILFLAGLGLYIYSNAKGLGLTDDSRGYLYAAHSFLDQGQMLAPGGGRYNNWPPLFPALLVVFNADLEYAKWLQIGFCLSSLILMVVLGHFGLTTNFIRIFYLGILVFGTPLILVGNFLWSEPAFIFLLSCHLFVLREFLINKKKQILFLLIFVDNLMCLQRLAGIYFILATLVILGFWLNKKDRIYCLVYALLSFVGFSYWYLSFSRGATQAAGYLQIKEALLRAENYFNVASIWILPKMFSWLGVFLILFILILGYYNLKKVERRIFINEPLWIIVSSHIALYFLASFTFPARLADFERYLAVIFPMFFLLLLMILEGVLLNLKGKNRIALILFLSIWFIYPSIRTLKNVNDWHKWKNQKVFKYKNLKD